MDLEFRNLTYTVQSRIPKSPKKVVVKGVHGRFLSGQLVAIMGPSGAGKSSLLNMISGYRSAGVTGELLVNGQPRDEHHFQRSSCYITQEDLLQPLLTVREAMDVAARLKLPKGMKAPSEEILQELGLLEHQNTRTDELSGGQKKRLSIALEMVNNPPVFFLDEPTSGLDNVTTTQCVKLLKQLARQGRTVVCTIHQPPASLLELFDQLNLIFITLYDTGRSTNAFYVFITYIVIIFDVLYGFFNVALLYGVIKKNAEMILWWMYATIVYTCLKIFYGILKVFFDGFFSFLPFLISAAIWTYFFVIVNSYRLSIMNIFTLPVVSNINMTPPKSDSPSSSAGPLRSPVSTERGPAVYVIADGRCIYQGDSPAMVPYLQNVGFPCPRHHNPADFIIELTEDPGYISILANEILNGKVHKSSKLECAPSEPVTLPAMQLKICYQTDDNDIETQIMLTNEKCTYKVPQYMESSQSSASLSSLSSRVSQVNSSMAWMKIQHSTDSCGYPTSFFEQFSILLFRMMKQISRNRQGLWIQLIHHVMCGTLIGICFYNMANDGTQMFNHLKLCVGLVIFFAYTQIMVPVLVYPQEVKLVKKEHFNCWYSLTPYYAALTVSKLPVQVTLNIVFCTIVFFMAGVPFTPIRFAVFCVVGNVVSLAAEGMGMAIGSIFNVRNGCAIGPASIAPFLGLGIYGFDFAHQIPLLMNILMKTSFIRCGIVAMVLTIFGFNRAPLECSDVYCHFAKPEVLIKYLDIETSSVWFEIITMIGIMLVFRSICFLGLRWRFTT